MINNTDKDYGNYTLGAGAGYFSYKGIKKLGSKIRKPYTEKIMDNIREFSTKEKEALKQATYDGFVNSGLKAKKYYLHDVTPENVEFMTNLMNRKILNMEFIKKLRKMQGKRRALTAQEKEKIHKKLTELLQKKEYKKYWQEFKKAIKGELIQTKPNNVTNEILKPTTSSDINKIINTGKPNNLAEKLKAVSEGNNAFCLSITRDIMISTDKLAAASFHEMGHALNASGGKLMKSLVIGSFITKMMFVPIILAVSLLKNKKQNGEKPEGIIDKTTTFIKNNAGKLTFASLVPMLAEEGLASIRGAQIAKKVLDPKLLKKVNKNNFLAWTTYLAGALITTGAVVFASKIRDKIVEK